MPCSIKSKALMKYYIIILYITLTLKGTDQDLIDSILTWNMDLILQEKIVTNEKNP